MRCTFKTVFYVNGSKERNGIVPVMGRVTINGTIAQFSCKQGVAKAIWDAKGNRAVGKSKEAKEVKILGITGTHSDTTPNQIGVGGTYIYGQKEAPAMIYPLEGYMFGVMAPQLATNTPLVSENIKNGVQIMGVAGKLKQNNLRYISRTGICTKNGSDNLEIRDVPFTSISQILEIRVTVTIPVPAYNPYRSPVVCMTSVHTAMMPWEGTIFKVQRLLPSNNFEAIFDTEIRPSSTFGKFNFRITAPNNNYYFNSFENIDSPYDVLIIYTA